MIFLTAAVSLLLNFSYAENKIARNVNVKAKVNVWTDRVCLADIIVEEYIQGAIKLKCGDNDTCCPYEFKDGNSTDISKSDLENKLNQIDFGLYSLTLVGSEKIVAVKTGRQLTEKEIRVKLDSVINKEALSRFKSQEFEITVQNISMNTMPFISFENEKSWRVQLISPLHRATSFKIIDSNQRLLTVGRADLRIYKEAYHVKKAVAAGEELKAEDFELKKINILEEANAVSSLVGKESFPIGSRTKQSLYLGAALQISVVEKIPTVKFGDMVTLVLKSDHLKISTKATVQGTAGIGDTVNVMIQKYNKTFRGRLVEGKVVEVWL